MKRRKEHAENVLPAEAGGWSLGSLSAAANTVTVLRRTAWALLVAGPVLAGWALVSQPSVTAPAAPVRQEQPTAGQPTGPGGFAELFVSAYLTAGEGTEALLAPFLPNARDVSLTADPGVQRAQEVAAVRVRLVSSGYWSVTVAARVAPAGAADGKKKPEPDEVGTGSGPVLR
ncbi:hypothetical protein [Streptomyces sp. NPDC001880]